MHERGDRVLDAHVAASRDCILYFSALVLQLPHAVLVRCGLRARLRLSNGLINLGETILSVSLRLLPAGKLLSRHASIEVTAFHVSADRDAVFLHPHVRQSKAVVRVFILRIDVDGRLKLLARIRPGFNSHEVPRRSHVRASPLAFDGCLGRGGARGEGQHYCDDQAGAHDQAPLSKKKAPRAWKPAGQQLVEFQLRLRTGTSRRHAPGWASGTRCPAGTGDPATGLRPGSESGSPTSADRYRTALRSA